MPVRHPSIGALLQENGTCQFTVWAPQKHTVTLLLEDEQVVRHGLQMDAFGFWQATLPHVKPGTRYRYAVEGGGPLPDPASRSQPDGVHGASAVASPQFGWTDQDWQGISLGNMVMYELHTGTFTTEGTFDGIVSRLGYLKALGVNTLELMPVAQFPGTRNWGYDGVFPYAVQHSYGGVQGLKQLVNAAHEAGMAVILDVVYNHQGPEGNYLGAYGPYFTQKYHTFWGQAINFDDAWCFGVRHYYLENALMWLDEFHLDGLRLDAVHAIWDFSAHHFVQALKERVAQLEADTGRKKVLIAEFDLNNPRYITPIEKGGYGLDGQWIDEYHHALHALVTGETNGYYEDFGTPAHLVRALKDSYVYTGQYSRHRKKFFGVTPTCNNYDQFVVFAQNHDQVGNRLGGDRLTQQLSMEALKLTAAVTLLSPHTPMLFMGEEYGETKPFQYFISHTDPSLIEAVRKGRREEFTYFQWEGEIPDPQAVETFEACILSWQQEHDAAAKNLFAFYQYLIAFRKERPAMQARHRSAVSVFDPGDTSVVAFAIEHVKDPLLIVFNFDKNPASFTYDPSRRVKSIFDSSATLWQGPGERVPLQTIVEMPIQLNPESAMMLEVESL